MAISKADASLLNQIVGSMTTALVVLNADLQVLFINTAAEHLLQQSNKQLKKQPLQQIVLLSDEVQEALFDTLSSQQPFTEREALIRLPDNVSQYVDFTVNILEGSHAGHLLLELQPLNRLQRINKDEESVARQETARRLISGLAHEIKNPLGGIRGAAQLLEQELDLDAELKEHKEYTQVIIGEADRLKQLVDRLLGPQRRLDLKRLSILQVVERVIALLEAEHPNTFHWVRDYDPSLPELEADETQMIQAVMNIMKNACQALTHTDEPRIQIRTRAVRQFTIGPTRHRLVLQLDITDNGPGIEPALKERIFFPMISGRPEGTGLGLAITQNVINQHHGSVQMTSRPGQTCFTVYLPFDHISPAPETDQYGLATK